MRMTQLKTIADIQTGPFGSQLHKEDYVETGTPIVTVEHLGNRVFTEQNLPRVSDSDKARLIKYTLSTGDIVFSRVGSVDRCSYVDKSHDGWMFSGRCLRVRPTELVDSLYLYYYFCLEETKQFVRNIAVGATMPSINTKLLGEVEIALPDLNNQKRIAAVLSSLDDKIENNQKLNDNLQQQAQALFKKWFVDNPDAILWKEGTFSNLIEKTISGDWGKDSPSGNNTEMVYCIRGADIPEVRAGNKGKMPTRYILPKNYAAKQLVDGDIVVEISGGSPTQSTGRAAAVSDALLARYDKGMVCTNFCKALKPRAGYSMYVYYYWQYLYDRDIFFSYENGTTGIKNLDINGFIETEPIVIAPEDLVEKFDAVCQTVFSKIYANGMENEQLALVRDTILPKLMSGEIDVSAVQL